MNNSYLAQKMVVDLTIDTPIDVTPTLREEETKLVKVVEAIREIHKSKGWSTLKSEIFDGLVATLEKELMQESKKQVPDMLKLNRLTGQLIWAEKYSDLLKLENFFKQQLTNVRIKLHGTT